jgi:ribonuclease P protein component
MLIKSHRFHGYGSVRQVYAKGHSIRGGAVGLKYSHRDPNKPYRVAVVVSRKVNKSAVVRNRIRRRIYEAVRTSNNQPAGGTDLIFTVFSEQLAELPAEKLHNTINSLLQKIN